MKVLKKGNPRVTCSKCKAELELNENDVSIGFGDVSPFFTDNPRTGTYQCPECNKYQKVFIPEFLYIKIYVSGQNNPRGV